MYIKFLETYPNLEDFLKMNLNIVEDLIKSLGLLFRAEILNEIASKIIKKFEKKIPQDFSELKSIKGIGDYNANAILCFGFGKRRALLDSNFIRIFKRVFNVISKTKTAKTDKFLWDFSEKLLPEKDFIPYNYGILDIGGNICLNRKPKCSICPLNELCYFFNNKMEQ